MKHPRDGGFTLVELLVVVGISAVMAAVAVPALSSMAERSQDTAVRGAIAEVRAGVVKYLNTNNGRPVGGAATVCLRGGTDEVTTFLAPLPAGQTLAEVLPGPCPAGSWTLTSGDDTATPAAGGDLPTGMVVNGYIAPDGAFCLNGYSTAAPERVFHLDSRRADPMGVVTVAGTGDQISADADTCGDVAWTPEGEPEQGLPFTLPDQPANLTLVKSGNDLTATWDAVSGATGYRVTLTGPALAEAATTTTTQTTFTRASTETLPPGVYAVKVIAVGADGVSPSAVATLAVTL